MTQFVATFRGRRRFSSSKRERYVAFIISLIKMLTPLTPATFSAVMKKSKTLLTAKKYEEALDVIILIQEDADNFMKLGDEKLLMYYNNVALLYYQLRKPHLSICYFNKAHKLCLSYLYKSRVCGYLNRESPILNPNTVYNIMYNLGLCMLMLKKPYEAFCYLRSALSRLDRSPLLWLRLAECCMMISSVGDPFDKPSESGSIGAGCLSATVLNSKLFNDSNFSTAPQTFSDALPSLAFATLCLKNSYLLLPPGDRKLKETVLAASCYVHLAIGGQVKALKYAKMLFKEASSNVYKYLSVLYLAESLILLNRTREAITILKATQDLLEDQNSQKCGIDNLLAHISLDLHDY